jgi:hypothetical protein
MVFTSSASNLEAITRDRIAAKTISAVRIPTCRRWPRASKRSQPFSHCSVPFATGRRRRQVVAHLFHVRHRVAIWADSVPACGEESVEKLAIYTAAQFGHVRVVEANILGL